MPTLRPLKPPSSCPSLPDSLPATATDATVDPAAAPPLAPAPSHPANPQKFRVRVAPSAIDGQGAFADEAIPARRKIGEIRGEFIDMPTARARAREAERRTGRIFMIAISNKRAVDATHASDPLRFANHACVPNVVMKVQQGRIAFYALRDIAEGEELTIRYGETHHAGRLTCRCGAATCQGRL